MKWLCLWLAFGLLPGCDGVGAALVGKIPNNPGADDQCNAVLPPCSSLVPTLPPSARVPVTQPLLCQGTCGQGPLADDLCEVRLVPEQGAVALNGRPCQRVELDLRGLDEPVRLEATFIALAHLTVHADRAIELTLATPSLENVEIALDGPITLRVAPDSTLRQLHVHGSSDAAIIALERTTGNDLTIDGDDGPFPGRVMLYGASFFDSVLRAAALEIESAQLTRSEFEVADLRAADVSLQFTTLSVGTGSIASGKAQRLEVQDCDALLIAGLACEDCVLRGCSAEPLRLDSVQLARGFVLGDTTFVGGSVGHTLFGMGEPTRLRLFDVQFDSNVLCEGVEGFGLSGTDPSCIDCRRADLGDSELACDSKIDLVQPDGGISGPDAGVVSVRNVNPQCPEIDALPLCDPALTADRPFR